MIKDGRSNKVIFLSHCLLNSNAIAEGPKTPSFYPGMTDEVVEFLLKNKIGVIQTKCPEKIHFGLIRKGRAKSEMDTSDFRKLCNDLAKEIVEEIDDYQKNGLKVLGFMGKRGSPSCGVKETWTKDDGKSVLIKENGIFIEEIKKELQKRNIVIPFIDFEREDIKECINDMEKICNG